MRSVYASNVAAFLQTVVIASAKELIVYPSQDVYVEKLRPSWSYRTSVLQVGRSDSPGSEYRAFIKFDLSAVASSRARVMSARLRLHPLLSPPSARITHHACLLSDVLWQSDDVTWDGQPDRECRDRSAPCCGNAIGSWQPKQDTATQVELTYYVRQALSAAASQLLALHLYAPTTASSREHYYVQYGSSRRGDASRRPELILEVIAPTSPPATTVDGKGLYRAIAGSPSSFTIAARDAEGVHQAAGGDLFRAWLTSPQGVLINASVMDANDGTYTVGYTPTIAALYSLDIQLDGISVGNSPYTVTVFPAATSPAHCFAWGAGTIEATAGKSATFLISPRDSFGNVRPLDSSDAFTVVLVRGRSAGPSGAPAWQPAVISDMQNGTYSAEYTVKQVCMRSFPR